MKVKVSLNEEKQGVELLFDSDLSMAELARLRELGFKRTSQPNPDSLKWDSSTKYKWFVKEHPAYVRYAEMLKEALKAGKALIDVPIYPSFEVSKDNLERNRFSVVDISYQQQEALKTESLVVFDHYIRVVRAIVRPYAISKYGDSLKGIEVFARTHKAIARQLLKDKKTIGFKEEKETIDLKESPSVTPELPFKKEAQKENKSTATSQPLTSSPQPEQVHSPVKKASVMDIQNSDGNEVPNILAPAGINKLFISRNLRKVDIKALKEVASAGLWQLTDEKLESASARELFELIQFGHPGEYGIQVSRGQLLKAWVETGQEHFVTLGLPIDPDYPYVNVHTGYRSVNRLADILTERNSWWSIAEHWRPIANIDRALEILDDQIQALLNLRNDLVNPKTQKPFGKNKDEYNSLGWKIERTDLSRNQILEYKLKHTPIDPPKAKHEDLDTDGQMEFFEFPLPDELLFKATILLEKYPSGQYRFGLKYVKEFGVQDQVLILPREEGLYYKNRQDALDAALGDLVIRIAAMSEKKSTSQEHKKQIGEIVKHISITADAHDITPVFDQSTAISPVPPELSDQLYEDLISGSKIVQFAPEQKLGFTEEEFIRYGTIGFDKLSGYKRSVVNKAKKVMKEAIRLGYAIPFNYGKGKGKYTATQKAKHLSHEEIFIYVFQGVSIDQLVSKDENLPIAGATKPTEKEGEKLQKLAQLLRYIEEQNSKTEWDTKTRRKFNILAKTAFFELAQFIGLRHITVLILRHLSNTNGAVSLKGMLTKNIGTHLVYQLKTDGSVHLDFSHVYSIKGYPEMPVSLIPENSLAETNALKKKILSLLKEREAQKEEMDKGHYQIDTTLNFYENFLVWFDQPNQHLLASQITWPFFQKWMAKYFRNEKPEKLQAAWKQWQKHVKAKAKIAGLTNGLVSSNVFKHFNQSAVSGVEEIGENVDFEKFKSWIRRNYPDLSEEDILRTWEKQKSQAKQKKKLKEDYKRVSSTMNPIKEIHISIYQTENGQSDFDANQAQVFTNWTAANDYMAKLSRALVSGITLKMIWLDGFSLDTTGPVLKGIEEKDQFLSNRLFDEFFEVFYNPDAWAENEVYFANKLIQGYQLFDQEDTQPEPANPDYPDQVIAHMHDFYYQKHRATKKQIEALAQELQVPNMGLMWEAVELSWMLWYQMIYREKTPFENRLEQMIQFWNEIQPTYAYSDSSKEIYKQYSTPCPIGAILSEYTNMAAATRTFEPSAGNGLLVLGANPKRTHVNEIDRSRLKSLAFQGFSQITHLNASVPFPDEWAKTYDVMVTNPPFASWEEDKWDKERIIHKYFHNQIGLAEHIRLEHLMAGLGLHLLKDDGKAAIIIMGHINFKEDGYLAKYRPFFNWLYRHYHVDDVINMNSFKLYNKQGAVERTMLILIRGRKATPSGVAPTQTQAPYLDSMVNSFTELWHRVQSHLTKPAVQLEYSISILIKQLKIELDYDIF